MPDTPPLTALDHLRRLLETPNPDCCCDQSKSTGSPYDHSPDCPWMAARGFVDKLDCTHTEKTRTVIGVFSRAAEEALAAPHRKFYVESPEETMRALRGDGEPLD